MATGKAGKELEKAEEVTAELVQDGPSGEVSVTEPLLPASRAWDQVEEFDRIEGFDLEKDKMELVGVPFVITKVTYREGAYMEKGESIPVDYVSLELVTAPPGLYDVKVPKNRRRYAEFGLPIESEIGPGEEIVINDSSTGIKRQIAWYLHSSGRVTIAEDLSRTDSTLEGSAGQSAYDLDPAQWFKGSAEGREGIEVRLLCKRGLRFSRYSNDFVPEATTFYLA